MKRTGPTNEYTRNLIQELKKHSASQKTNFWKSIATNLEKSTRQRRKVNLSKIEKHAKDNETIIVPGKVLGTGSLTKKVTIAAFQFSDSAKNKVKDHLTIHQLMKKNPTGKGVRIIG
tara:strand:+ start:4140 stop:4490 length:351 start_codon:yes stop_codon:yes gene_type:complete